MLKHSALISLATFFLHATTWEGHIFHKPAEWLRDRLPEGVKKPLFDCPICMTPYYGALILALLKRGRGGAITTSLLTLFAAAGISTVLAILSKFYTVAILLEEDLEGAGSEEIKTVDEVIVELEERVAHLKGLKNEER